MCLGGRGLLVITGTILPVLGNFSIDLLCQLGFIGTPLLFDLAVFGLGCWAANWLEACLRVFV